MSSSGVELVIRVLDSFILDSFIVVIVRFSFVVESWVEAF